MALSQGQEDPESPMGDYTTEEGTDAFPSPKPEGRDRTSGGMNGTRDPFLVPRLGTG